MKRLLSRAPYHLVRDHSLFVPGRLYGDHSAPHHLKLQPALMENISLNTEILKSLQVHSSKITGRNTKFRLVTPQIRDILVRGHPITKADDWHAHAHQILEHAVHYTPDIYCAMLAECPNLVYEHPSVRRELLDDIMDTLISVGYPITESMYTAYLNSIKDMKQNVNMSKVFRELTELNILLSYVKYDQMELADVVCYFLGLNGDTEHIYECWKSFQDHRAFRGFRDKSFSAVITGHVMRGEYDQVFDLMNVLENKGILGTAFLNRLADSLARVGNLEVLDSLIRNMGHVNKFLSARSFKSIYLELIENEGDEYIPKLLDTFVGFNFEHGRTLEAFCCDVLSRGYYSRGADLVVYGKDGFQFNSSRQRRIFETDTLLDIKSNMSDLDNILIRLELRGMQTKHTFDFSKIGISIKELDNADKQGLKLCAESDDLIQRLYHHINS